MAHLLEVLRSSNPTPGAGAGAESFWAWNWNWAPTWWETSTKISPYVNQCQSVFAEFAICVDKRKTSRYGDVRGQCLIALHEKADILVHGVLPSLLVLAVLVSSPVVLKPVKRLLPPFWSTSEPEVEFKNDFAGWMLICRSLSFSQLTWIFMLDLWSSWCEERCSTL